MGKERLETRLRKARENGYLDANFRDITRLKRDYGLWCWRLRIPVVWHLPESRRSRFGRVYMDMLTTGRTLTPAGMAEVESICAPSELVYSHGAVSARMERAELGTLARRLYKAVTRPGNSEAAGRRASAFLVASKARSA